MVLKHRLADASYWVYDRSRHKTAFEAAAQPERAPDFSGFEDHKYALLVTFRKDGTAVPTPAWLALLGAHRFVARTEERTAKARILATEEECAEAEAALDRHYGRTRRIYEKVMADERGARDVDDRRATTLLGAQGIGPALNLKVRRLDASR